MKAIGDQERVWRAQTRLEKNGIRCVGRRIIIVRCRNLGFWTMWFEEEKQKGKWALLLADIRGFDTGRYSTRKRRAGIWCDLLTRRASRWLGEAEKKWPLARALIGPDRFSSPVQKRVTKKPAPVSTKIPNNSSNNVLFIIQSREILE
jgi:hypothetical protein